MEPPSSKRKCTKIDHNYSVQDTFNGFDNEDIEESRSRLKKFELAISPPQEAHSPCGFTEICEEEDFKPLTSLSQAFPPIPDLIQDVVVKKDEPELFCINPYKIHCGYDQEIRRIMTPKFLPSDAIFNRRDNCKCFFKILDCLLSFRIDFVTFFQTPKRILDETTTSNWK